MFDIYQYVKAENRAPGESAESAYGDIHFVYMSSVIDTSLRLKEPIFDIYFKNFFVFCFLPFPRWEKLDIEKLSSSNHK